MCQPENPDGIEFLFFKFSWVKWLRKKGRVLEKYHLPLAMWNGSIFLLHC